MNLIPKTTTMYVLKIFFNHRHSLRKENLATLRFLVMINSATKAYTHRDFPHKDIYIAFSTTTSKMTITA
jgi:hypothetical protein